MPEIELGNVYTKSNGKRSWIAGSFIDQVSPFHTEAFEVKWCKHKKGETKPNPESGKLVKTVSVLVYGKFRTHFPEGDRYSMLEKEGDYVYFGEGVKHTWEVLEDSLIITFRWPSLAD